MGVQITELLTIKEIELSDLSGKIVAIDAFNQLYQFLTTIRGSDGAPLSDSHGKITSHLVGLFARTVNLLEKGIKPVFIFDGKAPELKAAERERRMLAKIDAQQRYELALKEKNIDEMKKYAARTARLTDDLVKETKELIALFGLPIIQAPSEAEAQAAFLVKNNEAYAVASQDADSLLFGAQKLIRHLSVTGKRKLPGKMSYDIVKPTEIDLSENLNNLGIDNNQLIALGILVGTDFNPGGIKGIGPKNALKLVKKHETDFEKLFEEVKWNEFYDFSWKEIFEIFKNIPITKDYELKWKNIDKEGIIKLLHEQHDFSKERVENSLNKLLKGTEKKQQKGLGDFI
jgi:flap endonuclease-1